MKNIVKTVRDPNVLPILYFSWYHFCRLSFRMMVVSSLRYFPFVMLCMVMLGFVLFSYFTFCSFWLCLFSSFLSLRFVLLGCVWLGTVSFSYVRFCFITLSYVHGTYRHIKVFPLSPHMPHLLSVVVFNLHISPLPLLSLQSCRCPHHHRLGRLH
jgi:hypothetical protein